MIMSRIYTVLAAVGFVCGIVPWVHAQTTTDKVVVSYPSKSITNFPILETARQKGFFQKEALNVSAVYMRGGIDIKHCSPATPTSARAAPRRRRRLWPGRRSA